MTYNLKKSIIQWESVCICICLRPKRESLSAQCVVLYLQMNIKATRKNVTNDFRINFRYVFVRAKTTLSMECQKMQHKGGF